MLSEKVNELCAQLFEIQDKIAQAIYEETDGLLSLCKSSWIQISAAAPLNDNRDNVEQLVGPLTLTASTDTNDHFQFKLGNIDGVVLLKTSKARGEADDVSTYEEA